jgi:hypothetical protein
MFFKVPMLDTGSSTLDHGWHVLIEYPVSSIEDLSDLQP